MSTSPRVLLVENFLSESESRDIIHTAESKMEPRSHAPPPRRPAARSRRPPPRVHAPPPAPPLRARAFSTTAALQHV